MKMRVVIGVPCFILMLLLNPIESMFSILKKLSLSKKPMSKTELENLPKLAATLYVKSPRGNDVLRSIEPGPVYVQIMEIEDVVYVIGYVEDAKQKNSLLYPFVIPSPKSGGHHYKRIIIRVEANYAENYIPLDRNDPLNTLFSNPHNPDSIRLFNVDEKSSRRPLKLFKLRHFTIPASPSRASSSRALESGDQVGHLLDLGAPKILDVNGKQVEKWRRPEEYIPKR
ncbi:uncharacterized protein LOC117170163 [Belonocnema kinseyi]|uniref:uncharacterized protein LOC117170163 n=1 Tax=Belonocnema kinseyi TaxID=2817044 RepID=UPI00143DD0DE|nr:uncharacterized protein LOC117170163 [Belonocnema kinseyi]